LEKAIQRRKKSEELRVAQKARQSDEYRTYTLCNPEGKTGGGLDSRKKKDITV
jgi:hypothetical protein